MNVLFVAVGIGSLVLLMINNPESAVGVMLDGAGGAIDLAIKLIAVYSVWLSILKIMEATKLSDKLARLFSPITRRLFKHETVEAQKYISMNLAANLLGMGGAATPMGIKAIECMYDGKEKASDGMVLFMIINATSIQLLPMTVISLRAAAGSTNPSDIILPSLIVTAFTTFVGIVFAKLFTRRKK